MRGGENKKKKSDSVSVCVLDWKHISAETRKQADEAHPEERTLGCYAQLGPFIELLFISCRDTGRGERGHEDIRNFGCLMLKNDGLNDLH